MKFLLGVVAFFVSIAALAGSSSPSSSSKTSTSSATKSTGATTSKSGSSVTKTATGGRASSTSVTGKGAVSARSGNYNLQKLSSSKPYSRFNPSFKSDDTSSKPTQLQVKLSASAQRISQKLSQPMGSLQSGRDTFAFSLDAMINPLNPYYWLLWNSYSNQTSATTQKNMMLNDRIIEQSAIVEECLKNASIAGIPQDFCTDASFDLRVELTGILSNKVIASRFNPFGKGYKLSLWQIPGNEDTMLAETGTEFEPKELIKDRILWVLNMTATDLIAALGGKTQFYIQVGDEKTESVLVDLKNLIANQGRFENKEIAGKFAVRATLTKILPNDVKLSENMTQPLGLNLESVKICARYMIKLNLRSQECFKSLYIEGGQLTKEKLKKLKLSYNISNGKEVLDSNSHRHSVTLQKNLSDILASYYDDFYNLNFQSYNQFGIDALDLIGREMLCSKNFANFLTEGLDCSVEGTRFTVRLGRPQANIFEKEANDLLISAEESEMARPEEKDYNLLEKFNNPYQVGVLRVYLMTNPYDGMIEDIIKYINNESQLQYFEKIATQHPEDLKKIRVYYK